MQMGGASVSCMAELIDLMSHHLARFEADGDHRAAFLRVYRRMSMAAAEQLQRPFFIDPPWVERVAIRFAWYYFDALERYEQKQSPPPAWAYAFRTASQKRAFLLQDILLGMNAHINNDLPLVVAQILREEHDCRSLHRTTRRRFDHDQINRLLFEVIPAVEADLSRHQGRLLLPLGRVLGRLDQHLATFGLKTWRDQVWRNARFLVATRSEEEERLVRNFIQQDALRIAKQIDKSRVLGWCRPLAPLLRRWRLA